jgi:hypothetical protein
MVGTGIRLNPKAEPSPVFGCILYMSSYEMVFYNYISYSSFEWSASLILYIKGDKNIFLFL